MERDEDPRELTLGTRIAAAALLASGGVVTAALLRLAYRMVVR
jgi:hypothetical protein